MPSSVDNKLIKIAVFYDGNFFSHISNYYNYEHERRARLSISGLHNFICETVAKNEDADQRMCRIVDAHYFRGRLNTYEANERNRLFSERLFDDILMSEGVTTHYLPLRTNRDGRIEDKGIEMWLALEAFEQSFLKQYNVLVLIAGDSEYVSLVRKLNSLGIRVLVLAWDFEFTDERTGKLRKTVTSVDLLREATYPVQMHDVIDSENEESIDKLFIPKSKTVVAKPVSQGEFHESVLLSLKNGYGFIEYPPNNLYFHWTFLEEGDFNDLQEGDLMEFQIGQNDRGQDVAISVRRLEDGGGFYKGDEEVDSLDEHDETESDYEEIDYIEEEEAEEVLNS